MGQDSSCGIKRVKIGHVAFEEREGIEREHHAETKGGVGRILLEDIDLPTWKAALDQQREEKAGGRRRRC